MLPHWLTPTPDSAAAQSRQLGKSPWLHSIHLLWSIWVFITPMFSGGYNWRWLWLTLASYPLFLLLFALTMVVPRRLSYRPALAMVALSMALLPWYPSGISYFVFGCVMLHTCGQRFIPYLLQVLALNVVFVTLAHWIGYPWQALAWLPAMTLIIGTIVSVDHIQQEKDVALKLSHDEVRRLAATAERERIGRDLHDLLGHTLSLITLKLELSRKLLDRDLDAARREVTEAETVARHALAEVRSAVTGIRATDLAAELASARLLLESSAVSVEYDPPPSLPAEIERGLALVLREAATNITRHARATRAQVRIVRSDAAVQLQVIDNGRGGIVDDGNGLSGMRERVRALGGTLAVQSPRGGGTTLEVRIPLPSPARDAATLPAATAGSPTAAATEHPA